MSITELKLGEVSSPSAQIHQMNAILQDFLAFNIQWGIQKLHLRIVPGMEPDLTRLFLKQLAGTLQHLVLEFGWTPESLIEPLSLWTGTYWFSGLNQLETLEILGNYKGTGFILFTLQLPHLKKLKIQNVPSDLNNVIEKWNSYSLRFGWKLQSKSLVELEIDTPPSSSSVLLSGNLWPNLKTLKLSIKYLDLTRLNLDVLKNWTQLERLELDFQQVDERCLPLCEKWLIGLERPKTYKKAQRFGIPSGSFLLKDLKSTSIFSK
jgi:hypothetical protein